MSLLKTINESAQHAAEEQAIMIDNINRIDESLPADSQPLTEAVTDWLAALRGKISKGALDPNQQQSIAKILGGISALSDQQGAASDSFEEINRLGLGNVLYNASAKKTPESSAAVKALHSVGSDESARTFTANALKAMEDPQSINNLIDKLQTSIDQVMRTALAKQKGGATSATGGAGVGGSPERQA